jgi:hypothetical protein
MPPRRYSGPLLPGSRSVRKYETKKQRMTRMKSFYAKKIQRRFRKSYKPSPAFTKQMNKYNNLNCEKKIMVMNNYLNGSGATYLQDIDGVGLNNAGLINSALTCVVLQTGRQETTENLTLPAGCVKLMDGYSNLNGTLPGRLIGQYAKITSSYINLNITMNPTASSNANDIFTASLPHQFRLIQVKAKNENAVAPGVQIADVGIPSIAKNLFRNEEGNARGINSDCATQDIFTWFVNKQFWTVLKDERFTLATPTLAAGNVFPVTVSQHKSSRFKKYWLPKPKDKVLFRSNTVGGVARNEVVDYNYVVHTIILCKNASTGERPSNHWSVQANGATAFIDE